MKIKYLIIVLSLLFSSIASADDPPPFFGRNFTGDVSVAGELSTETLITPYQQIVSVAKSGAEFDSIQDAIDSITDASVNKKYIIIVYPGTYTENITLKDYVSLSGAPTRRTAKIYGTSGTLVTLPATESHIFWVDLEMDATTDSDIIIDATAGAGSTGFYRIENTDMIMTSSANIKPKIIDANCGVGLYVINATATYTMTGTATGTYAPINLQTNNNLFYILRSIARAYIGGPSGNVATINDNSAGRFFAQIATLRSEFTNASNTGICVPYAAYGAANTDLKQVDQVVLTSVGNGSGNGYITYVDSSTNNTIVDISRNIITVEGFTNNRRYTIATGDTIRSYFNKSTNTLSDVVNGTLEIACDIGGSGRLHTTTGEVVQDPVIGDPDTWTPGTEVYYGGKLIANATGTDSLPAASEGMLFSIGVDTGAVATIDMDSTGTEDTVYLNGVSLSQGEALIMTGPTYCDFRYRVADTWSAECTSGTAEETP